MITDEETKKAAEELIVALNTLREYCKTIGGCYKCAMSSEACKVINGFDDEHD